MPTMALINESIDNEQYDGKETWGISHKHSEAAAATEQSIKKFLDFQCCHDDLLIVSVKHPFLATVSAFLKECWHEEDGN